MWLHRLWDARRRRFHPLADAALAIGVAGAGRIALNSLISVGFGAAVFGRYAAAAAGVLLVGSLAASGPSAATTLGVARRWGPAPGTLPRGLIAFLARLLLVFVALAVLAALLVRRHDPVPLPLWGAAMLGYVLYQVARSAGYALDRADAVTRAEAIGATLPLLAVALLLARPPAQPVAWLIAAFTLGPVAFLMGFGWWNRGRVRVVPGPLTPEERRRGLRESAMFLLGAGSSMAMQYLPVVIAGRLEATTTAAVLFGALQATTPLLLLPRVYGAVMMPAFAADTGADRVADHLALVRPLFVPSLALALGLAPWVAASLGLRPEPSAMSVAALVALMTLLQVWATPAVTVLSARQREVIPAVASAAGLAVAGAVWVVAVRGDAVLLLPVGLALGAVVRSLVPVWMLSGRPLGRLDGPTLRRLVLSVALAVSIAVLSRGTTVVALAGGAALITTGLFACYRVWATLPRGEEHAANRPQAMTL